MRVKHSRRPWHVEESFDGKFTEIHSPDDRISEPVCVVDHDDVTEKGEKVVAANIRLILSAPDLVIALHQIAIGAGAASDGLSSVAHDGLAYSEIAEIARKALAKAGL